MVVNQRALAGSSMNTTGEIMIRKCSSKTYNWVFNTENGMFARWGATLKDDPEFSPFGPEILDIEVSTICNGLGTPCKWCYKSNTRNGKNMTFETYKQILDKMPENLTQVAFGIGDIDSNPDLFKMFEYTRSKNIIPNVTINGYRLTKQIVDKLASLCGAVAVSRYEPKDYCYDAVKMLTDKGMKQVNIHMLLANETLDNCFDLLEDVHTDERLKNLNAVVFLSLKPKGKRNTFTTVDTKDFKELIDVALDTNTSIGFDSCSAYKFLDSVRMRKEFPTYKTLSDPCESTLFSFYVNVDGIAFPCSFAEDVEKGVDVTKVSDFVKEVWENDIIKRFRENLCKTANNDLKCRRCPLYKLE
jgi:radical SAM protein with 4Fe4S-binding SPASM domain